MIPILIGMGNVQHTEVEPIESLEIEKIEVEVVEPKFVVPEYTLMQTIDSRRLWLKVKVMILQLKKEEAVGCLQSDLLWLEK